MQPTDMQSQPVLNRPAAQQQRARLRPPQQPAVGQQPAPGQPMPQQPMAPPQAPTFAQMQAAGQARPAPPPMPAQPPGAPQYGGQHYGAPAYAGQLSQSIMGALQTPSAYGTPQVEDSYKRLSQNIDDDYAQRERATDERFASRGLYDSTANAGAMHDLNVGRRSAQETLAGDLADKQALDFSQARQGAIGQALQGALGYGGLNLQQQGLTQQGQLANRGMDINVDQGHNQNTLQLLQLLAALGINPQQAGG